MHLLPWPRGDVPRGYATYVNVEEITQALCGVSRPTHFRGVATVVAKLFNICEPDVSVFGQKDYQQLAVIRRMVKDLDMNVRVVAHPTVREDDGLAMSSRNKYLSGEQRTNALVLSRALDTARGLVMRGERRASEIRKVAVDMIEATPGLSWTTWRSFTRKPSGPSTPSTTAPSWPWPSGSGRRD